VVDTTRPTHTTPPALSGTPSPERRGKLARHFLSLLVLGLALALALDAAAQTYPTKPIRLIVPFPPGGSADILARAIGQKAGEGLGQSLVIENRPGAGTAIGAEALAKSPPDGYAIMIGTVSSHAINPAVNPKLPFDPVKDFTPVSLVASIPFAMVVHPSVPAKTVQEFIALARAKPGTLNYSSAGNGTSNHLAGELLKSMARIDIVHIPYKGSAPALNDLIAGQVLLMFDLVLTAAPHVKSGAVRGLAVTGAQRSAVLPELPTVAESGLPYYEVSAWFGIFAPAGVPRPVVERLNAEFVKALRDPDLRQRLASQGAEPLTSTPAEFSAYLRSEIDKWAQVVRAAGMKVD
jgi:tripartite-type tricarboxylate transporter receptor subunit TctC